MTNPVNTEPLTKEFLTNARTRVVFEPHSIDEAEYIVQQLQKLGFHYYRPEYEKQLQNTLQGSIYLDNDKTIMVNTNKVEGIAATADDFAVHTFTVPARKLSVDVMHGTYAVFPRSVGEGRAVLLTLKGAGAVLPEGAEGTFGLAARAVYQGLLVKEGRITFAPLSDELQQARVITPADLGIAPVSTLTTEQSAVNAAFNEMAARMEKMQEQITRLENELIPKPIPKGKIPVLGTP